MLFYYAVVIILFLQCTMCLCYLFSWHVRCTLSMWWRCSARGSTGNRSDIGCTF